MELTGNTAVKNLNEGILTGKLTYFNGKYYTIDGEEYVPNTTVTQHLAPPIGTTKGLGSVYTGNIDGTNTPYEANGGFMYNSNLSDGQTTVNQNGQTITGKPWYLGGDTTSDMNYMDYNNANGGKISPDEYARILNAENKSQQGPSGLDYTNMAVGLGSLGANIYYANKNQELMADDMKYAQSRDAKADEQKNLFASRMA